MGLTTALLTVLLGQCIAYEIFEEDKRQQLYPFPRIGRSIWDLVEGKRLGGLMPFPRVGRTDGKRQGLIPFPRIGRSSESEYDDDSVLGVDDWLDDSYDLAPSAFKRASKLYFQPRIGRRKRSVNSGDDDESKNKDSDEKSKLETFKPIPWPMQFRQPFLSNRDFFASGDQIIDDPRIGRGRGMFEPRIGKKYVDNIYDGLESIDKRALVPRVGRSDHDIQTRAMFQPRVGRALVPRVGRSDKSPQKSGNTSNKT